MPVIKHPLLALGGSSSSSSKGELGTGGERLAFGLLHKDSARPVYLKERAHVYMTNNGNNKNNKSPIKDDWRHDENRLPKPLPTKSPSPASPPERPPKKPHLRSGSTSSCSNSSSPTPSTQPPSSRGATPTRSLSQRRHSKPKFPSPPSTPKGTRRATPPATPPVSIQGRELPPLPVEDKNVARSTPSAQTTLRICDKDSPAMSLANGGEPMVVVPQTPKICAEPNVKPSMASTPNGVEATPPARPPKRESPATIAAKGAPGWEKFLGGQTSTVQFTSEEVDKLKSKQRQSQQNVTSPPPRPPPKPKSRPPMPQPLETNLDELEDEMDEAVASPSAPLPPKRMIASPKADDNIGLNPIHSSKSSPSLQQQQLSPVSRKLHAAKSWKNSLDNLKNDQQQQNGHGSPVRGFVNNPLASPQRPNKDLWKSDHHSSSSSNSASHAHSNSDSGLSSLSGRASTMSPISTMSTVSSVSSASSQSSTHSHHSGSSSRASLRSASIVSSCTIPLDEEDEVAVNSPECSPQGTMVQNRTKPFKLCDSGCDVSCPLPPALKKLPEEAECEELGRDLVDVLRGAEDSKKIVALFDLPVDAKTSADYLGGLFGEPCEQISNGNSNSSDDAVSYNGGSRRSSTSTIKEAKALNGTSSSSCNSFESARRKFSEVNGKTDSSSNGEDLAQKKEMLLSVVTRKSEALKLERDRLRDAAKSNEERGRRIWRALSGSSGATAQECDKYRASVEEADKIASLLSGLAARMARAENAVAVALAGGKDMQEEKEQLSAKRDKLSEQLSEARRLKSNIDRRSEAAAATVGKYLGAAEEAEHRRFLAAKVRIIVDARDVQDRMQTAEEQILALKA